MLLRGTSFPEYDGDFLALDFDYVSQAVDGASITHSPTSGRDGRGGLTFAVGGAGTFAYDMYAQFDYESVGTIIAGAYVNQTGAQGALGGRLFTFVDAAEDIFGSTVQVGINIMSDGKLKAFRANAQGTGIVLRGPDQGGDSQMTELGVSASAIPSACFVEVKVEHHSTDGAIVVMVDDESFWTLTGVNTAISGRNLSASYCIGGYASINTSFTTRSHEDLAAVIGDIHLVNTVASVSDPAQPVGLFGDHKWTVSTATADGSLTEFTPDPVQAHYLNINEDPPDSDATNNSTTTIAAKDDFAMSDVAGTSEAMIAYRSFAQTTQPAECVSGNLATFGAFVFAEQDAPGSVIPTFLPSPPCNFTDFPNHRAQSVCTIRENGESVKFKLSVIDTSGFKVCLSPLDAPPRVCSQTFPGGQYVANYNSRRNTFSTASRLVYGLPWYQPWAGYGLCTEIRGDSNGDEFSFKINGEGTSMEVGLVDHDYDVALDPYSPTLGAFHFREDIEGLPYFYIGPNFSYSGETIYSYVDGDSFKIRRTATAFEFRHNGILLETITPVSMPLHAYAFSVMGRWGYRLGGYSVRPEVVNGLWTVSGAGCILCNFSEECVRPETDTNHMIAVSEVGQWGILFLGFEPTVALIADPAIDRFDPVTPGFGWDLNTEITFKLEGGFVVLEVRNWLYLDLMTDVGGVGTYTYSRPFSQTDDFALQAPANTFPIGLPVFPFHSMEFAFTNGVPNMPLRLVPLFEFDEPSGINSVQFTFNDNDTAARLAGIMNQSGTTKSGTSSPAPETFRFKQSFLGTDPSGEPVTIASYNDASHGYTRDE